MKKKKGRVKSIRIIPKSHWVTIALDGFILNAIWEFAHAGPLYDMWEEVSVAAGFFHITLAILGDVVIVLSITFMAGVFCGFSKVFALRFKGCLAMISLGFAAGLVLEWIAKALGWWTYYELMPTLAVMGEAVGLSPLLQVTLLPFISVLLADKIGTPGTRFIHQPKE